MNQNLRRMIIDQFPNHRDQENMFKLLEISTNSPKNVKQIAKKIIDELDVDENN